MIVLLLKNKWIWDLAVRLENQKAAFEAELAASQSHASKLQHEIEVALECQEDMRRVQQQKRIQSWVSSHSSQSQTAPEDTVSKELKDCRSDFYLSAIATNPVVA